MSDWTRVTVRIDEQGGLEAIEVDGDIDKSNLTEERPETPPALPAENPNNFQNLWGL